MQTKELNEWFLEAPPGMRFVNEQDGGVTLQFPRGKENEVIEYLSNELNRLAHNARHAALKAEISPETNATDLPPASTDQITLQAYLDHVKDKSVTEPRI